MSWLIFTALLSLNLAGLSFLRQWQKSASDKIKSSAAASPLAEELLLAAVTERHEAFRLLRPQKAEDIELDIAVKSGEAWTIWRRLPMAQGLPLLEAFETLQETRRMTGPKSILFSLTLPDFEAGMFFEVRLQNPGK